MRPDDRECLSCATRSDPARMAGQGTDHQFGLGKDSTAGHEVADHIGGYLAPRDGTVVTVPNGSPESKPCKPRRHQSGRSAIVSAAASRLSTAEEELQTPSCRLGWTPLGLVTHPGFAGRRWFRRLAAGPAGKLPRTGMPGQEERREPFTTGLPAEVASGSCRDQCERANAIVATTPLPAPSRGRHPGDSDGEICGLCRIIAHMTGETAGTLATRHRRGTDRQPRRAWPAEPGTPSTRAGRLCLLRVPGPQGPAGPAGRREIMAQTCARARRMTGFV